MNPYRKSPGGLDPSDVDEPDGGPDGIDRRDFLKAAGFTALAASAVGCERIPTPKAAPFLIAPEELVPGRALRYASVCSGCEAGCGALVKAVDGRPIKMEGLPEHPLSRGGLCAMGQATLLGLYDSHRLQAPTIGGETADWAAVDAAVKPRLAGGKVRILTRSLVSPTARALAEGLVGSLADARLVVYDPLSCSAIPEAHERTHGARVLPRYRFDKARVVVGFGADFLGTWISPVEHAAGYSVGRRLDENAVWHAQFESTASLTGSNADERRRIAPGEVGLKLSQLAGKIAARAGATFDAPAGGDDLDPIVERLWNARGKSLVVCGDRDVEAQVLVNFINQHLGNYGETLDVASPSFQKQGDDRALEELRRELDAGEVDLLVVAGVNPVYDRALPVEKAGYVVCVAQRADETTALAHLICAESNEFESWADAEPAAGIVGIRQPAMNPRGRTRSLIEILSAWRGEAKTSLELVKERWKDAFPWAEAVERGFAEVKRDPVAVKEFDGSGVKPIAAGPEGFALVGYAKVGLGDGRHAYNPWLQELPDPVSKATWDNYACLSVATAARLGVTEGDVVRVEAGGAAVELPAMVQPGQHDDVVAVAIGYGQRSTERFADVGPQWFERNPTLGPDGLIGADVGPLLPPGLLVAADAKVTKTGRRRDLASTQTHHNIAVPEHLAPPGGAVRPCVLETTLQQYREDPASGVEKAHLPDPDLFPPDHPYEGRKWAMAIDLTRCTGCSACVVACQAENNVPVVGRDEVQRRREMHWMRIDRYYRGEGDEVTTSHQPMLCQHCENAPCESVCPVLATVHTEEGLNAQAYNRCVGTRYCANNCPYKVRRFNWFDYPHDDPVENLVLNPNVTVRSRGVMEKCTFCVQRIQEETIQAKKEGKLPADGVIKTACQQSCPTQAIVFGDGNDPESAVSKALADPRRYYALEELNVRPSVGYLTLVRDRAPDGGEGSSHG
mgnify:CR=1 FL=1